MSDQSQYRPAPIDVAHVVLPAELLELREQLAENAHEVWAARRMTDGWTCGPQRDDARKTHPCLVPYDQLTDSEKEYDRILAMETLKTISALGFRITKG